MSYEYSPYKGHRNVYVIRPISQLLGTEASPVAPCPSDLCNGSTDLMLLLFCFPLLLMCPHYSHFFHLPPNFLVNLGPFSYNKPPHI